MAAEAPTKKRCGAGRRVAGRARGAKRLKVEMGGEVVGREEVKGVVEGRVMIGWRSNASKTRARAGSGGVVEGGFPGEGGEGEEVGGGRGPGVGRRGRRKSWGEEGVGG